MAICGSCKASGVTVEHVRNCYMSVATLDKPMALSEPVKEYISYRAVGTVPDSKYALQGIDGSIVFYEVKTGKGKWAHVQFVSRLVGHPGDFMKYPVRGNEKARVLSIIAADPHAAAVIFGKHFTVCAVCSSPLTDPDSRAMGIGPICQKRF